MAKYHTPPKTIARKQAPPQSKANQTKHQTQSNMPTPPEVENTKFYQLSLDKPHDKHMRLKQQRSQSTYGLGTKATRVRTIINDHKHKPHVTHKQGRLTRHIPQQEQCGPPQQPISKQG
jgi:Flp pilus assembly protein TadD